MATQTPKRDNTHGESVPEPLWKPGDDSIDPLEQQYGAPSADSRYDKIQDLRKQAGLDNSGYDPNNPSSKSGGGRQSIKNDEEAPASGAVGAVDPAEQRLAESGSSLAQAGGGLFRKEKDAEGRLSKLRGRFSKKAKKRMAIASVTAAVGVGGAFGAGSYLYGPFQFVHFSQKLAKHFRSNEEFGNDRTSKTLIYALAGKGIHNSRLGVAGNAVANKWEKRLLDRTGLRPIYQSPSGRFVGFEIVDENKAKQFLLQDSNAVGRDVALQTIMGDGAKIRDAGNHNNTLRRPDNTPVDGNRSIVDLSENGFGGRRTAMRTAGDATQTNKVASTIGSRLLIKRGGVNFHPMNKVKQKTDDWMTQLKERRAKTITDGVESVDGLKVENTKDTDGKDGADSPDSEDVKASEETKSYISDFKSSGAFKSGAGATVVVGVLCAAKTYGSSVEEYKYVNNIIPMLRLGFDGISRGDQTRSGDDFDMDTLRVMTEFMYDEEKKTSWNQSESVRAEDGKEGGLPPPKEADLRNAGDKPQLFKTLDGIPFLGTTCNAVEGFFGLPIIKQVSGVISSVSSQLADAALSLGNTSSDELMESSLRAVAGKSVDPDAEGADYGNLANTGAFLAANDQAISTGGKALSQAESIELAMLEQEYEEQNNATKSFAGRYLNPYDEGSAVSSLIDQAPSNPSHAASMLSNPIKIIGSGFSSIVSHFIPRAKAAGTYDYGVPKYGFSVEERKRAAFDMEYENPYLNAEKVEPELDRLNEQYGDKCFGMTVTVDEGVIKIDSADKPTNIFKVAKEKDCDANQNTDDLFNHYRFFLADAVTLVSLACYEGDEAACAEIGMAGSGSNSSGQESSGESNVEGVECPSSLRSVTVSGTKYYQMPEAPDGEYTFDPGASPEQRYGKKELVCVIYTVAKAYKAKHGDKSTVKVGDLNATGHASHKWGVGVDINAKGSLAAADRLDGAYDKGATLDLGKMFIDTGKVKNIWWCGIDGTIVELANYAKEKGTPITIQCLPNHEHHFHVDINAPRGPVHMP